MMIRYVSENDKATIKDIWSICFPEDHEPFLSWFFDKVYKPENTLAAYEDDARIVANLQLIPHRISFRDIPVKVRYLVGAATLPEFRRKGIMAELLKKSIEAAAESNCPFILLLPFSYPFYRKFGWETCYYYRKYKTPISNIHIPGIYTGRIEMYEASSDIPQMNKVYTSYHSSRNGWILRSAEVWERIICDFQFDNGQIYLHKDDNGHTDGYAFFRADGNSIAVSEAAYTSSDAMYGIWSFVAGKRQNVEELIYNSPPDNNANFSLFEDPGRICSVEPFVMARVTDVRQVLLLLADRYEATAAQKTEFEIRIQVDDPLCSRNNGVFYIVRAKGSKIKVTKLNNTSHNADHPGMSAGTFTMLSMGAISPEEARLSGLLRSVGNAEFEVFEVLFGKTVNFMNELF